MTKKDFTAVAKILRSLDPERFSTTQRMELASEFAAWFKRDNPRFDVERFMLATPDSRGARAPRGSHRLGGCLPRHALLPDDPHHPTASWGSDTLDAVANIIGVPDYA